MKTLKLILIASFAIFVLSCGGGSSGTGGQSFEGSLRTTLQQPVAGTLISVLQTGDSDITDDVGNFSIDTNLQDSNATLLVEGTFQQVAFSSQVALGDLPPNSVNVIVNLQLDQTENKVKLVDVQISDNNQGGSTDNESANSTSQPSDTSNNSNAGGNQSSTQNQDSDDERSSSVTQSSQTSNTNSSTGESAFPHSNHSSTTNTSSSVSSSSRYNDLLSSAPEGAVGD